MKIRELIRAFGYSLTYNEDITIVIGSNNVRFIYDQFRDLWEVLVVDFEGHLHRIAVLTAEDSVDIDRYSTWCDQDYNNHTPYDRTIHTIV